MTVSKTLSEIKGIPTPIKIVGLLGFLTTVLVNPWTATDPVNLIKLGVICIGGFMLIPSVMKRSAIVERVKSIKLIFTLCLIFLTQLIATVIFSGGSFAQQLYGVYGRNNGFIAYFSLTIIFLACVFYVEKIGLRFILAAFFLAGFLSTIYGTIQSYRVDPIKWTSWNPVIGFLGNTNFQASLLGMFGVLLVALVLNNTRNLRLLIPSLLLLIQVVRIILSTSSQQGILVLLIGVVVILWLRIRSLNQVVLLSVLSLSTLIGVLFLILGTLQIGFFKDYVYKDSVSFRGDYWQAGYRMILDHPLFGVGLDSYGAWYRQYRDVTATLRRGPEVVSDNAHNVFIDFGANGGLILFFAYLGICVFVLFSAIKALRRSTDFDPYFSTLLALWVGYQAQSVISINQLGLAVWGWIFGGAIIGYAVNSREPSGKLIRNTNIRGANTVLKNGAVKMTLGGLVGLTLVVPTFLSDSSLHKAQVTGLPQDFANASKVWPPDETRLLKIGMVYFNNAYYIEARQVFLKLTQNFPRSFDAWQMIANLPNSSESEKKKAISILKSLDPHNSKLQ